jgi:predicted GIY-YIG superfamily endonuclease
MKFLLLQQKLEQKNDYIELKDKQIKQLEKQIEQERKNQQTWINSLKINQSPDEEECKEMEQSPIDFDQNGNMFICKLKLPSGELIDIPIRSDGYMNATLMCKAHNKRFNDWKSNKETQDCIQAISSDTRIPVSELIAITKGGNYNLQGSWVHPDLAIQLAQWLSPMFAIQVSRWTRELLLTGKVELGKEKTPLQLEEKLEDLTNKIRFDLDPYTEKDVIYFYQVVPKLEYAVENEERDFYEFGVTSDIVKRDIAYTNDKHYEKVKLKNVIVYGDRNKASRGEKRIKNIIVDLDIKAVIGKKKECFMATLDELDSIYKQAVEHSGKLNTKRLEDGNMEMKKYKINMLTSLFEKGKLTFDQLKELMS